MAKVKIVKQMKVGKKGERGNAVTIPNPICKILGIEIGDMVEFELINNELKLKKVKKVEENER